VKAKSYMLGADTPSRAKRATVLVSESVGL
jgi:hypothetical protein